jgi:hypothetical protein
MNRHLRVVFDHVFDLLPALILLALLAATTHPRLEVML